MLVTNLLHELRLPVSNHHCYSVTMSVLHISAQIQSFTPKWSIYLWIIILFVNKFGVASFKSHMCQQKTNSLICLLSLWLTCDLVIFGLRCKLLMATSSWGDILDYIAFDSASRESSWFYSLLIVDYNHLH